MSKRVREVSKKLSWLLRHGAPEAGVDVDAAGWAQVSEVLRALKMNEEELDLAILENNKSRLERRDTRVRASQGHSHTMPVDLDALEASWTPFTDETSLWHGTREDALPSIRLHGLQPQGRTHVHLAKAPDARVGKRANVDVLLEIDPRIARSEGAHFYESNNGVVLVRHVPARAILP